MPVYEYRCQSCEHEMEVTQRITEQALRECPACGAPSLERLISQVAFQLKGGGWYKDGYNKKKGKERTENDRIDRLSKAIEDDKKKSAEKTAGGGTTTTTSSSSESTGSAEKAA